MQRWWNVTVVILLVIAVAVAGFVLHSDKSVPRAGQIAQLPASASAALAPSTSASTSTSSGTATPTSSQSTTAPAGRVIAFLGDDWTEGVGASPSSDRFSSLVAAKFGLVEANFGVAGTGYATSSSSGGDYQSRVSQVVAANPAIVVVTGGRNDVKSDARTVGAAARQLFTTLAGQLPGVTIIAVSPLWGSGAAPAALAAIAKQVRRAVTRAGGNWVPITDPLLGHPDLMATSSSPDDAGYAAIASVLERRLRTLIASR